MAINFFRLIVLLFFVLVVSPTLFAANGPPGGGKAATVVVAETQRLTLSPTITVPATVQSRQEALLPAEVAGRLIWVADVGSEVRAGQAVARLDDTLYQLRAKENKANLLREQSRLVYLEKEVNRIEALIKENMASRSQVEKNQLERDMVASDISLIKAKIQVDEETLARYQVVAPFNGVVVAQRKRLGEWIGAGEAVVMFANPNKLEIVAQVPELSIKHLKVGGSLSALRNQARLSVTINALVPVGDAQSHLYELRLTPTNSDWLAGQTIRIEVPMGDAKEAIAIPRDALVLRRSGAYVYRVKEDNNVDRIDISTGISSGEYIEVINGKLQAGDRVIVRGGERLRPGQSVNPQMSDKRP